MTPTMGIQMPIAIFFAAMLKWSKISAAFGVWITNPLTSPFIYGLTYIVDAKPSSLPQDSVDFKEQILFPDDADHLAGIQNGQPPFVL